MTIGSEQLANYTFTGTNGTTPPAVGTTVLDSNPTPAQIQTNKCQFTGNFTGSPNKLRVLAKASMGAAPVRVEVQLSAIVSGFQGVFFHNSGATGAETGYYLYFDAGNFAIDKFSAGTGTTILASSYIGSLWSGYETGIMRFEFDVVGGNAVLTARSSTDSYASSKTVTDSTSPIITKMDLEYWSADGSGVTSTIDNVVITGTGVSMAATAGDVATAAAALSTQIKLGAAAADVESSTGALTTAIRLAAAATDAAAASGSLAAGAVLAATALDVATATAALSTAIRANGQAIDVATANGTLTNWASVTLSGTLYTGQGGALDPNFWLDSVPQLGTTLYYDATHITIYPNAEISSDVANCAAVVQFFDGTDWALGLIVFTDQLAAVVKDVASSSAAMSTAINLAAAASALATATAAFSTGAGMNAAGTDVAAASGALTTKIPLSALAAEVATAVGALTNQIKLGAVASDVVTANAQINGIISLQAAATVTAAASAALTTQISPAANAQVLATGAASMTTAIRATASAADIASAAASLSSAIVLIAQAVDASSSIAALTTSRPLVAAAIDVVTSIAVLSTGIKLSANDVSIAQATADLSAGIAILANATSQATATAVLTDIIESPPIDAYQMDARFVISASMIDESIGRRTPRFINKDPLDRCVLCFDFADQLEEGETLTGKITMNVAAIAGSDPSATGIFVGVPSYDAAHMRILQPIFGGIDACKYYIKVAAATTNPQKSVSLAGLLPVAS
jgi:hypothetical protein